LAVDLIVALRGDASSGVSYASKMNDTIDTVELRSPIERLRQIGMLDDLDTVGKREWRRPPHRGAHSFPASCRSGNDRATQKAGGAGHQNAA